MVSFVSDFYSVCYNTYCMKQVAPWKFKKADEEWVRRLQIHLSEVYNGVEKAKAFPNAPVIVLG